LRRPDPSSQTHNKSDPHLELVQVGIVRASAGAITGASAEVAIAIGMLN
jgi:hypothetical protein